MAGWCERHPLAVAGSAPLAVAYSGGADSTALLLAVRDRWPDRARAFHVHHGLQAAGDDFEAHARAFCARHGVPLRVAHVQAAHAPGQSPEDAARRARYEALARMAQEEGASCVLLGQHADDQAETLLLALSRGAGLPGLAAMPEHFERHGVVFGRPLLDLPAQALRAVLNEAGHAFVDDPSNADARFTRNRIRATLMPAWAEAFPGFRLLLARSARHAAQAQRLLDELAAIDLAACGTPPAITPLRALSRERQANALRAWLRREEGVAPSAAQLEELLDQIAACTTRGHRIEIKVASGCVVRDGERLCYRAG
ncbi:tRNA lysidine(34) synthetase TilS [Hydrogenophaga sp.]|uniref:tRNA lysidine(34) synthetase TilS n=1 Tax=Hydrogenophaga sp. TaxID=1904254 RepID=UPI00262421B1|nr:tRNA lysidine(34) synthetase TilS [Hydrogenophaga sp.]MCW5654121.1 tRNA lysidine(34) synthetase TilS [Hydrogenophaga sp.]